MKKFEHNAEIERKGHLQVVQMIGTSQINQNDHLTVSNELLHHLL